MSGLFMPAVVIAGLVFATLAFYVSSQRGAPANAGEQAVGIEQPTAIEGSGTNQRPQAMDPQGRKGRLVSRPPERDSDGMSTPARGSELPPPEPLLLPTDSVRRIKLCVGLALATIPATALVSIAVANPGREAMVFCLAGELVLVDSFLIGRVGGKFARVIEICLWSAAALCVLLELVVLVWLSSLEGGLHGYTAMALAFFTLMAVLVFTELVACALLAGARRTPVEGARTGHTVCLIRIAVAFVTALMVLLGGLWVAWIG